jgi:hypothetical protein
MGNTQYGNGHVSDQVELCMNASSRNFYKMVCILYNILATRYLTKPNLPKQYFTQEAAPGYGCDECVTRDIGRTNFNPPPTHFNHNTK